ncbi:MAG: hypothetical protein KF855_11565 [Acidobacteria bacterium]|nr:hypothetical protein [Acidobacteriota bacterium]
MSNKSSIEILTDETEQVNPTILLAEEFMRRDMADVLSTEDIERTEEIIYLGHREIDAIKKQLAAFDRTPASASSDIPTGF